MYLAPGPASVDAPAIGERTKLCETSDITQFSPDGALLAVVLAENVLIFDTTRFATSRAPFRDRSLVKHVFLSAVQHLYQLLLKQTCLAFISPIVARIL